jgi:hypothetical protein
MIAGWAIPTFAGRAFVEVSARIVPVAAGSVRGPSIVLPDGSTVDSGRLQIDIEIINRYPLPVLIEFHGAAFRATLTNSDSGSAAPVWKVSVEDPTLEQADESPSGDLSRVVLISPGTTEVATGTSGMTLDLAAVAPVAPGRYSLRVTAYGIGGSPQPIAIVGAGAGTPPVPGSTTLLEGPARTWDVPASGDGHLRAASSGSGRVWFIRTMHSGNASWYHTVIDRAPRTS